MPIFKDNYFTNDSYLTRAARLEILQKYVDDWKGTLSIPESLVKWAKTAHQNWIEIRKQVSEYKNRKKELIDRSNAADEDTFNFYLKCKRLLKNQHKDAPEVQELLGIDGYFPRKRNEKIKAVEKLLESNKNSLFEEEYLAPDFYEKLLELYQRSKEIYEEAHSGNKKLLDEQRSIYDEDSKKLRTLYSWALMFWEPHQPYLVQLGFAVQPSKTKQNKEAEKDEDME